MAVSCWTVSAESRTSGQQHKDGCLMAVSLGHPLAPHRLWAQQHKDGCLMAVRLWEGSSGVALRRSNTRTAA